MSGTSAGKKTRRSVFAPLVFSGIGASRKVFKTAISKTLGLLSEKFVRSSARSIGAMGASYGLLSIFIYLGKYYILTEPNLPKYQITMGIVILALSLPLFLSEKPIAELLQSFPLTDYIFFDFFSIKRLDKNEGAKGMQIFSAVLIGFIPAFIGVFVEPIYVIAAALISVFVALSFVTPEFTLIFTVLIAPYLSPIPDNGLILALLSLLCALSFFFKLIAGKRFYNFEIYDAAFIILGLFFIISGIVNGRLWNSFIMLSLTLGYATASNLIVNRRLAECVVNAQIISSLPISTLALSDFIISLFTENQFTAKTFFASTGSYGAYMLITAILALYFAKDTKSTPKKIFYYALACLDVINIIISRQISLWFALILALASYIIIENKKMRKEWLFLFITLPYLFILIPDSAFSWISDLFHIYPAPNDIFDSWEYGFDMLKNVLFFGNSAISKGTFNNTLISFAISFGIFSAAILIIVFAIRLCHLSSYIPYMKNSELSITANSGALAVFALFALAIGADIFSDITIYYLFVSVFGITSASLRYSKHEYDERVGYYGTVRADDASDISIRISV